MNFTAENKPFFRVQAADFEGPLDLLLSLIEKRKLFINDISLSKVSDDYIATLQDQEILPVNDASGFLLIASTLVLIKSKSLLPELPLTSEEEGDVENLEERLLEYKQIRELSAHVSCLYGKNIIYRAGSRKKKEVIFAPDTKTDFPNLLSAMNDVLRNLPEDAPKPEAEVKKVIRVEDVMSNLLKRVTRSLNTSFYEFTGGKNKVKQEVIVSFIAVLELVKTGAISATQNQSFSDIQMQPEELGIPEYQ